eukprot:TRINITY_DN10754_c0_g1_i1.p1 TRINITY_DN10754_c0_g1~~TRINITY_DN10754_c0_g1_i1.p1  ORF type:complete len:208 (+),score=42.04 TRINITY_DN10754_c0_g1_i1:306-929(+)
MDTVIKFNSANGLKYGFLSNLSDHSIKIDGRKFPSVEHYLLLQKFQDSTLGDVISKNMKTSPEKLRQLCKEQACDPVEGWNEIRDEVMYQALLAKFRQHPHISDLLVATGIAKLENTDTTSGKYWSVGQNKNGKNKLGQILALVRGKIRREGGGTLPNKKRKRTEKVDSATQPRSKKQRTDKERPRPPIPHKKGSRKRLLKSWDLPI